MPPIPLKTRQNLLPSACLPARRGDVRAGFSIVELLVVIVVIATLLSLLLPAIYSARNAANRMHCQSNMRSIGQAVLDYESGRGRYPYGRLEGEKYFDHSWATVILPYIEEQALFDAYDWKRRWNEDVTTYAADGTPTPLAAQAPSNQTTATDGSAGEDAANDDEQPGDARTPRSNLELSQTDIAVYQCPASLKVTDGAIDFGGNYGTRLTGLEPGFLNDQAWASGVLLTVNPQRMLRNNYPRRGVRHAEIRDGASHTFLLMENVDRPANQGGQWANGHNCFSQDLPYINLQRSNEIYSKHHRTAHTVMADGSLMVISDDIDYKLLGALGTRAGGEYLDFED